MATQTITVPEAGKSQSFPFTGLSVIVLAAPSYQSISDAAKLSLNQPGDQFPVSPGNALPSDAGEFQRIYVTGTDASAGDEVTLMSRNICLDPIVNAYGEAQNRAVCGTTFSKVSTDDAQALGDLEIEKSGLLPSSIYITASTADLHVSFDIDADQSDDNHLLIADAGDWKKIQGIDFIHKLSFASAAANTPGTLVVTAEY